MPHKGKKDYSDFSNVKNMKNNLIPEEFPEGAFGSSIQKQQPVYSKSTSWKKGQRRQSAYVYSYKELHEDLPRQTPGAHIIHDQPDDTHPQQDEQ